jgi:hypothetical protein
MTLQFQDSNYINQFNVDAQHVFYHQNQVQKMKINNCNKIVVHLVGAGGGGGYGYGGGGGSGFTILDFPYFPFKEDVTLEITVGKGGSGGTATQPAQDGTPSIVKIFKGETNTIVKEFVAYGGKAGEDYYDLEWKSDYNYDLKKGGDGGMNTIYKKQLMNVVYPNGGAPIGGNNEATSGSDCRIYYLAVSGAGGGSNKSTRPPPSVNKIKNNGGSFILHKGGQGYTEGSSDYNIGGGGGASYFGYGGRGGIRSILSNPNGQDGEENTGAGGGGGSFIEINSLVKQKGNGGNGANGMVIIENYGGNYTIF